MSAVTATAGCNWAPLAWDNLSPPRCGAASPLPLPSSPPPPRAALETHLSCRIRPRFEPTPAGEGVATAFAALAAFSAISFSLLASAETAAGLKKTFPFPLGFWTRNPPLLTKRLTMTGLLLEEAFLLVPPAANDDDDDDDDAAAPPLLRGGENAFGEELLLLLLLLLPPLLPLMNPPKLSGSFCFWRGRR